MSVHLIQEIDEFLVVTGMGDFRFGLLAANNGRLVERLRSGGRVWPETEQRIREFMVQRQQAKPGRVRREGAEAAA